MVSLDGSCWFFHGRRSIIDQLIEEKEDSSSTNNNNLNVIVTRCDKCGYDEFEQVEKLHTPMLKCMSCSHEMVDEFLVYGSIDKQ